MVDAFYFCVGGAVGKYAAIARQIGYRAAAEDCPEAIERLLRAYLAARQPGEDLRAYFARHDDESLRIGLAGTTLPAVERDPASSGAPGRSPRGSNLVNMPTQAEVLKQIDEVLARYTAGSSDRSKR